MPSAQPSSSSSDDGSGSEVWWMWIAPPTPERDADHLKCVLDEAGEVEVDGGDGAAAGVDRVAQPAAVADEVDAEVGGRGEARARADGRHVVRQPRVVRIVGAAPALLR